MILGNRKSPFDMQLYMITRRYRPRCARTIALVVQQRWVDWKEESRRECTKYRIPRYRINSSPGYGGDLIK